MDLETELALPHSTSSSTPISASSHSASSHVEAESQSRTIEPEATASDVLGVDSLLDSLLEGAAQQDISKQHETEAEPPVPAASDRYSDWYLGIDFGTTGISAVLLNQQRCQLYPIYWTDPLSALSKDPTSDRQFRLPAIVSVGELALQDWKPALSLAVSYGASQEPTVPWSEVDSIALQQLVQVTQHFLSLLHPAHNRLTSVALGLELAEWQIASQTLAGVIVTCPTDATESYRSNLRTAALGARLVSQPQQIQFVEEPIAALLSALGSGTGCSIHQQGQPLAHLNHDCWGNTLILSAGATATELAIGSVPADLAHLTAADFTVRSLPYAGNAIDQDILCQLIYPTLANTLDRSNQWLIPFAGLTLPEAGEPDLMNRDRLRQRLNTTQTGQTLQQAARKLKLMLQQKSQFSVELGNWQQPFLRQDVGSLVVLPYVQRLNRELNSLLAEANLSVMDVNQVICTGGTASLGAIARWLRQKLPNATIVQDTYRASPENCIPNCSRTAYGLATAPLHPLLQGWRSMLAQRSR